MIYENVKAYSIAESRAAMRRSLAKEIGNEERLITDDDCFPIQAGMCVANEEYLAEERQVRKQYRDSDFHSKILRMTTKRNNLQ